jgi:hypothetical protein
MDVSGDVQYKRPMDTLGGCQLIYGYSEVAIIHVIFPPLPDESWLTQIVDKLLPKVLYIDGSCSPFVHKPIWADISNDTHVHHMTIGDVGTNIV